MKNMETNPFLEQQYRENEVKANRLVAIMLLVFATFPVTNHISNLIQYTEGMQELNLYAFIPLGVIILILCGIAWLFRFSKPWIRPMLMTGLFTAVAISCLLLTTYVSFLIFIPVFVSMVYLKRKYTLQILVISAIVFVVCCVLNLYLDSRVPLFRVLHVNTAYNIWKRWIDVFLYSVFPVLLTAVYIGVFLMHSMKNARIFMKNSADNSEKIVKLSTELSMASDIQKSALPKDEFLSPDGGFAVSCTEVPAKEVGGDFYDYFMVGDHLMAFLIADVSDKGLPAAMFMMAAKKAIRCAVLCEHSLKDAVKLANRLICEDADGMFLTLWLGIIDTASGVGKYVNAGHLPPYLKKRNGELKKLENEPDLFMGPFPEQTPSVHTFRLEEGDLLFLYTDGLTDAENAAQESFGGERLRRVLQKTGTGAGEARASVLAAVNDFMAETDHLDDITLLVLECRELKDAAGLELSFLSGEEGTEEAITKINELLSECVCPEDVRRNADVILDEVLANIHEYAYGGVRKEVRMRVHAGSSFLAVKFLDNGRPFNPLEEPEPDTAGEPQIGGLGIWLYRNLADDISYCCRDGYNELTVRLVWNI